MSRLSTEDLIDIANISDSDIRYTLYNLRNAYEVQDMLDNIKIMKDFNKRNKKYKISYGTSHTPNIAHGMVEGGNRFCIKAVYFENEPVELVKIPKGLKGNIWIFGILLDYLYTYEELSGVKVAIDMRETFSDESCKIVYDTAINICVLVEAYIDDRLLLPRRVGAELTKKYLLGFKERTYETLGLIASGDTKDKKGLKNNLRKILKKFNITAEEAYKLWGETYINCMGRHK